MVEHTAPEVLARLATLETRLARYERRDRRGRSARRLLPLILAGLLVALVPLATLAANPFTDLTGGPHDGNIDAIYNAGITKGCNPPDNTQYCPARNVTREEMASFLARTAGLGGNPPVANAATAQTVPDGSVTAVKLSGAGSQPGQALVSTGTGVAWRTAAGPAGPQGPPGPTFGATAFGGSTPLPHCTETTVASLPLTVAAPSRIYATATGSVQPNGQGTNFVAVRLRLRNQADTATLAVTNTLHIDNQSNVNDGLPVAHGGVLRALAPPAFPGDERPAAATFAAPAGAYIVQVLMSTGGLCNTGSIVNDPTLTALLLGTAP